MASVVNDPLRTPVETGDLLGVKPETLAYWRWRGEGPNYVRVGKRPRYRQSEIDRWVSERERPAESGGD